MERSGKDFERPVLVVKGFNKKICLVVPLTTNIKKGRFYFDVGEVDGKQATCILSQIRLIDTKRFKNKIGYIKIDKLLEIKKAIQKLIE